jgi:hypothetical protein
MMSNGGYKIDEQLKKQSGEAQHSDEKDDFFL